MKPISLSILAAVLLAGCEARNPAPDIAATPPEPSEEALPVEIVPPADQQDFALEIFDNDTVVTVIDTGPQDEVTGLAPPKFALHCDGSARTLEVVAPARQLGPYAVAGPAQLMVSGMPFAGEAAPKAGDQSAMSMTLPVTPDLLAAVATATTARLVISDGFAESHADSTGAFPGFAGACSLKTGVALPAR